MRRPSLIFALILSTSVIAQAQANPRQLAEANRAAMDAYNNLEIEVAKETLEKAIAGAESNGLTGSGLARTYANLGVVEVGGFSDSAAALDAFVRALQEDATVEPDPLVSTPEVLQVFAQAKRKAGQGGGKRPPKVPAVAATPSVVEGNLEHVPAAEQLKNTDLPVFVAASTPDITSMKLFYRSVGMNKPKSASMRKAGDGFAFTIPCSDVFEPNVEYFVLAFDASGEKVGNAGTPENPVSVPIVAERSQPAPSLPGEVPPSQCGGGEEAVGPVAVAPASVANMGHEGSLGDTCNSDSDCGEGLACFDNFCAMGDHEDNDEDEDDGDAPKVYFDLGIGVGAVVVSNNSATDINAPTAVADEAQRIGDLAADMGLNRVDEASAEASRYGYNCDVIETDPDEPLLFDQCKTAVGSTGFVAVPVLTATIGYRVTPRLGLAGTLRYQFKHGERSIGLGGGLRADILLTEPAAKGFHAGLLGGVLLGRVQAKAPTPEKGDGPWASSGIFGVQLGLRMGYRFSKHVGLVVTPLADLMFSSFLFALDVTGGLEFAF